MNKQIRKLGIALCVCYLAVFGMLNYVQVFAADDLNERPENVDRVRLDFSRPRGTITTADDTILAESVPVDDEFEYQRRYPTGDLFAPVTGFFSFEFGSDGLERTYADELAGDTAEQELRSFADLFVDEEQIGDLRTTLETTVQQAAKDALGERRGSVAAINPQTGAVLALWDFPSYDPNALASHDLEAVRAARAFLDPDSPDSPLVASAYQDRFFPGSTFKLVTASTGLKVGSVTPEDPVYPVVTSYTPPQTTRPLSNFGGSSCGGALFEILARSCNSSFAQMGVEQIGPENMIAGAESFGMNQEPPLDLPRPVASSFPTDFTENLPALAQSAIGQNSVQTSPLQMAMVAGAIANDGVMMEPYVVDELRDADGDVIEEHDEQAWQQPIRAEVAATMQEAMRGVVNGGTANGLAIEGVDVGGKTGTAQLGTDPPSSHAWIVGWAGPPGGDPVVAVAVIVEAIPGVSEVTGGETAAPIANAVMRAALASAG